uniref:Ubiquitin-like modifier-activating enzyme atg7 n=1 Tax=Rhizophora mucronata TaxID=61149 RepID=A0A2P2LIK2_RHIMU
MPNSFSSTRIWCQRWDDEWEPYRHIAASGYALFFCLHFLIGKKKKKYIIW